MNNLYDVIIIGGGPAGLTAAIYLLRAKKKVLVIEKEAFGGQILKSSLVENYPGIKRISGVELGESFYSQAKELGMESLYGEVTNISNENEIFYVQVANQKYLAKAVIYATGSSPRKLIVPGESEFIGRGVSYCATCDGAFFRDKEVLVVGGGNTAVDDALYLSNICRKVYFIHRSFEFRAEPIKVQLLKEKENVVFFLSATVHSIIGKDNIEKVEILMDDGKKEILVNGIFVAIGSVPNTYILKDFVSLNSNGYILSNHKLETSVPGFYVAGDVREKSVLQLTTATSDGTIAAVEVIDYLNGIQNGI